MFAGFVSVTYLSMVCLGAFITDTSVADFSDVSAFTDSAVFSAFSSVANFSVFSAFSYF